MTFVQSLRICTGRTAYRGSRGIALPFLHHGTRRGWGVGVTPRPLFTPRNDPVPIVQEAGWAPGPVWTGAENLAPTGIRFPDRPARSQSLYRLSYPAHYTVIGTYIVPYFQNCYSYWTGSFRLTQEKSRCSNACPVQKVNWHGLLLETGHSYIILMSTLL